MLRLEGVAVHYGAVQALRGISLEIGKRSITALIGANGAGKSTCLKAISGLIPVTEGKIWFEDQRIDGLKPERVVKMGITHVPEGKRLFLDMTIADNLLTGAFLRKDTAAIQRDLNRMYDYFPALARARSRPASSLSGGEQQMLAIGRGLMSNPRVLMLDEPSLGLSPILTQEVASIVKTISKQAGLSVLLIEQNASLALSLASKGYVLETGKVVMEGTAKELQDNEHVREAYLGIA